MSSVDAVEVYAEYCADAAAGKGADDAVVALSESYEAGSSECV